MVKNIYFKYNTSLLACCRSSLLIICREIKASYLVKNFSNILSFSFLTATELALYLCWVAFDKKLFINRRSRNILNVQQLQFFSSLFINLLHFNTYLARKTYTMCLLNLFTFNWFFFFNFALKETSVYISLLLIY